MADQRLRGLAAEDPDETPSNDAETLAELRKLLVEPEQRDIAAIRERIENPEVRAEDISAVIAEAIELRQQQEESAISRAISPSVEQALRDSVRKDPQVLADALFPVMGPAIRRSIADAVRSMLEAFNKAMEHSFSSQGLRWRIESLRTGRPFAEVVLLHSLVYRVEQIFLIHRNTSLQLQHAVAPEVASQDPDLVAGMFSAIQDFVRDSFHAPAGQSLDSLQVGDLQVWMEEGPYASIAAVIRGHAPADYRNVLRETIERIHREFGEALERFDGDTAATSGTKRSLEECLVSRYEERSRARSKPYFAILAGGVVVLLLAWIGWRAWDAHRWRQFTDALGKEPGIVVASMERERGRYRIRGMRDPLAVDPGAVLAGRGLDLDAAEMTWAPYYALDDTIIQKRVGQALQPPPGVTLQVSGGVLHVKGEAPPEWIQGLGPKLVGVPGIQNVDTSGLEDTNRADLKRLEAAIAGRVIGFSLGSATPDDHAREQLAAIARDIQQMLRLATPSGVRMVIEVVGHSDPSGSESLNIQLSRQRAQRVVQELVRLGIGQQHLRSRGAGPSPQEGRNATFQVLGLDRKPAG